MREALPYLPDLHTADEDRAWVANVVLPHQEVWVAEAGGCVVGVAALDGDMLSQLYILPGEQGRGIGSALLAKAMARRPDGMRLYAFQRNTRARGFYERRASSPSSSETAPETRKASRTCSTSGRPPARGAAIIRSPVLIR